MLGPDRILLEGESPHPWEREAIKFIKNALPGNDPYLAALLVDHHAPNGKVLQLDALILGYHALYLVEIKSDPGVLEGDHADWRFTHPDGSRKVIDNPLPSDKARVLASVLQRRIQNPADCPWVEPVVFLSDPGLQVRLADHHQAGVLTVRSFARGITHGEIPLSQDRLQRKLVNRRMMRSVAEALKAVLTPTKPGLRWGDFVLRRVVEDGAGYQDWLAENEANRAMKRRVRVYPIPPSSTPERRDQLRRAADREGRLLHYLDHRGILRALDYQPQGPTGAPAVSFDVFEGAEPLDAFVRRDPNLTFSDKVAIVEGIAEALAYCHGKKVFHRALHPGAVLVRRREDGTLEPKLYNFQLATRADTSIGTVHLSAFSTDPALLYRAPEALENPERAGTPEAEVFSLGAIAYFVLTGRPPGATIQERNQALGEDGLSIAAASDALAGQADMDGVKSLDDVVRHATAKSAVLRADDVRVWLELFLDAASRPAEPATAAEVDPLQAQKGDVLAGGLEVTAVLGSGSTARALRVKRGDQVFALKVPLSPDLEPRLAAEADALRKAKSDRVVTLEGEPELAGRRCLLLGYAGETLAALLAREGPPSLDYARRWGEDLLLALAELEDRGILHRDVKPANLGVLAGESKKARHLFLFDFSLAGTDPARIELGTPAYRDPFLAVRPGARWDCSSDRYSAAVTLHEMVTGVLPRYGTGESAAVATDAPVTLAAERFDASIRDRLAAFFEKALDRDVERRHASADEMRTQWVACFAPAPARVEEAQAALDDAALAALPLDAPVSSLPLTPAAKNALDRSGVVRVRELVELPRNQLSSVRGVGRATVREILAFVERLRAERTLDEPQPAPFWPGYRGADGGLDGALPHAAALALEDAGLDRLRAIAAASKERVERVLAPFAGAKDALAAHFEAQQKQATGVPATVEGFLEVFLPAKKTEKKGGTWAKHVRAFYGLDVLPGAAPGDARSIAKVLGVTRAAIYLSLGRAREKWAEKPEQLHALHRLVGSALEGLGSAAPLQRLAEALGASLPHEAGQESVAGARERIEALIRICAETARSETEAEPHDSARPEPVEGRNDAEHTARAEPEEAGSARRRGEGEARAILEARAGVASRSLVMERVAEALWAATTPEHLQTVRALGAAASELAARDPLASSEEVERRLSEIARSSPLADLPPERLISLAAEASDTAARSARLELYPRGMSAVRALRLCAGAIGPEIAEVELRRLVETRYPEAERLPDHTGLIALLAELKLGWDPDRSRFIRAELAQPPSRTEALSPRRRTVLPPTRRERSSEDLEFEDFDQTIKLAVERRMFKVLDVNRAHAEDAAEQLEKRLGVRPRSLERELLEAAWQEMKELGIEERAVLEADRDGPQGAAWLNLTQLMRRAADRVAPSILSDRGPVVLKDPGVLARYKLDGLVASLVRAAQDDRAPAILFLNPVVAAQGPQPIDSVTEPMPIPTTAPAQRLAVPANWIKGRRGDS